MRSAGRPPNFRVSDATVAAGTPAARPRHPAWAPATAPVAGVGEEKRNAVGRLDGQGDRVIAGQDDIGLRKAAADVLRDHNVGAMNLTGANEPRRLHLHRTRDVVPGRRILASSRGAAKRPTPRGKDVRAPGTRADGR